jgi:hypothetical protein
MGKTRTFVVLALSALFLTRPVMAQTDKLAQINALPLSEICSQEGALGKKFGVTDLPPSTNLNRGVANAPLEPRFAPFDSIGFSTTRYSNKMYEVVFESRFDDEKSTENAMKAIAARFVANGWKAVKVDYETFDINLSLNAENAALGSGFAVILQPLNGGVMLTCEDNALADESYAEAQGEYPAYLPRPTPPVSKQEPAAIATPLNCDDPASSKIAIDAFKNGEWMPNPKITREEDYQERLAAWKTSKLVASGKVDREFLVERQMQLLASNGAIDALNKNVDDFSKLLPDIEKLEKLDKAGDTVGLCRGIKIFKAQLDSFANTAGTSNQGQWGAFHKFLDTEAMRLGVTYPEQ